jgi:hypothetical protein
VPISLILVSIESYAYTGGTRIAFEAIWPHHKHAVPQGHSLIQNSIGMVLLRATTHIGVVCMSKHLILSSPLIQISTAQLELYPIMARKGKPLADATRIAIIRMFHSGYKKKDIMKALDIGEQSFWRTLKLWRTNCYFRKHLTRETRGRPRKLGIIESSVCLNCTHCKY